MATSVVPPLQLLGKLGAGAFGEVFEGNDSVHGRVAVKVMSRSPTETPTDWEKRKAGLLAEAQSLSAAAHRNVVRVHGLTEAAGGDSIHLCMAHCPGGSLQSAYERGPLPLDAVRKIATEVTLGLDALHMRGMLHRDIKPGNIFSTVRVWLCLATLAWSRTGCSMATAQQQATRTTLHTRSGRRG